MNTKPDLCINCIHFVPGDYADKPRQAEYSHCRRAAHYDPMRLVDGREDMPFYCSSERGGTDEKSCGAAGKFFEPKTEQNQ
jgi:hypothetical protein